MAEEDWNGKNLGQGGGEAAEGVGAESCNQSALKTACAHEGTGDFLLPSADKTMVHGPA